MIILALILGVTIPSVYAVMPTIVTYEILCDTKAGGRTINSADLICKVNLYQMSEDLKQVIKEVDALYTQKDMKFVKETYSISYYVRDGYEINSGTQRLNVVCPDELLLSSLLNENARIYNISNMDNARIAGHSDDWTTLYVDIFNARENSRVDVIITCEGLYP